MIMPLRNTQKQAIAELSARTIGISKVAEAAMNLGDLDRARRSLDLLRATFTVAQDDDEFNNYVDARVREIMDIEGF